MRSGAPPPVLALAQCDLTIGRGEFVTVVGRSGSGKSTLLNLLGLLDRPSRGSYSFDGTDVGELSERQRSDLRGSRIGYVFQAFHLLDDRSVLENVMLAGLYEGRSRSQDETSARAALDAVGLTARADARSSSLSGGERQRVAIARALAADPALLLCDEPTGNLDSATSDTVISLLEGLHRGGVTVVIITHDDAIAARGHRILRLQDGRVSEVTREP